MKPGGVLARLFLGDLLITSDQSCVAQVCTGLQMPHIYAVFFSGACPRLHRIALPVVSMSPAYPRDTVLHA